MTPPAAFYEPIDEGHYRPSTATMSPWDERLQHGGPPSALALHALRRAFPRPDLRVGRLVVDFLGAIPRADMHVHVDIVRAGRRIELSRVTLAANGRVAVAASVWRLAPRRDVPVPAAVIERDGLAPIPPLPQAQESDTFDGDWRSWPYAEAIDWRFVRGGFRDGGPAEVWTRVRIPIVAGSPIDGVERIAAVADSANGISRELSIGEYLFVPTSIVLTLDREPAAEWTYLGATTHIGTEGLGFTTATLADEHGVLGTASQTLVIEPRGARQGSAAERT
jgi:hypothetical protein